MKDISIQKFRELITAFVSRGGNSLEILEYSGLLEAQRLGMLEKESWNETQSLIFAIEVYIKVSNDCPPKLLYLYSDHPSEYIELYHEGEIKDGNLTIDSKKLKNLRDKGFQCVYVTEEKENEELLRLCQEIWGKIRICELKPWCEGIRIAKNGCNIVILLLDYQVEFTEELEEYERWKGLTGKNLGNYILPIDVYALETCLLTLQKEAYIRENVSPFFRLKEDYLEDVTDCWEMLPFLEPGAEGVFLYEMGYDVKKYPKCYQNLTYQTAYIQYYYPDVLLKEGMESPDDGRKIWNEIDSMGIALGEETSYGACYGLSTKIFMVPKGRESLLPARTEYEFDGIGSMLNAGVAASKIRTRISTIKETLEEQKKSEITSIVISLPIDAPEQEEIVAFMEERKKMSDRVLKAKMEWEVARELEVLESSVYQIASASAKRAGIQKPVIVPRALAVGFAYEYEYGEDFMAEHEIALVYDWEENFFSATLIIKEGEDFGILWQENKEYRIWEELMDALRADMKREMLEEGEEYLKVIGFDPANESASSLFYDSAENVMRQVMSGKNAILVLENEWARLEREYPCSAFEKIWEPFFQETLKVVQNVLWDSGISETEIYNVLVAGEFGNAPFLWNKLSEFMGKDTQICIMADTVLAPAKGAAYLAKLIHGRKSVL